MRVIPFILFALALFAQDPGRGVNFFSLEKEKALGEQLAKEYRQRATVIESPEALAWVEEIAKKVTPPDSKYTYTFAIVADDGLLLNEPVALPGGYIFVPASLILSARTTDEAAGMIAHAIAHVEARHGSKEATKSQLANQASIPIIYMGGWAGYAVRQNTAATIPMGLLKQHRAFEIQADLLAAQMMQTAGMDPAALASYIERTQPDDNPDPARSALPSRAERVAAIRALPPAGTLRPQPVIEPIQETLRKLLPEKAKTPPRLAR